FNEDDRDGRSDQPHHGALQSEHAGRGRHRRKGVPGCCRIAHRIPTHSRNATKQLLAVIACDKREAFAQGIGSDEAIRATRGLWIASLRSQWRSSAPQYAFSLFVISASGVLSRM